MPKPHPLGNGKGTISATIAGNNCNEIKFSVSNLPPLTSNGYQTPFRSYFWDFGDGHYSFASNPVHIFEGLSANSGSKDYTISLQTTRIKSDDDIEESRMILTIDCSNGNCDASIRNKLPDMKGEALRMDINRSPIAGDSLTYILSYKNICSLPTTGILTLNYPHNLVEKITYKSYYGEQELGSGVNDGKLDFPFNVLMNSGEQRNLFVTIELRSNVVLNTPISTILDIEYGECASPPSFTLERGTIQSHDPNLKNVDQTKVCPEDVLNSCGNSSNRLLTYTIRFQNTGKGPAEYVHVSDELHPYLNTIPLNQMNISSDHNITQTTLINNSIEFEFSGINLPGTNQKGYGIDFREVDTWGEITYSIEVKDSLPACGSIVNQAVVVFDCHAPIPTTKATTLIQKSDCCDCALICGGNDVPSQFATITQPNGVVLPSLADSSCLNTMSQINYLWYPSLGLNDATLANPIANPKDTTIYTRTVFSEDSRGYITEVTVFPPQACNLTPPSITETGSSTVVSTINTPNPTTVQLEVISTSPEGCYQWYKDGILMDHETGTTLHVPDVGSYLVEYTDEGCSITSNVVVVNRIVSIITQPTFNFRLQPNFTQDEVKIHVETPQSQKLEWVIYNLQGRLLQKNSFYIGKTATNVLDFGNYPNGLYLVIVRDGIHQISRKVFKY